ncbi:N-acetyltransferase [Proteiniphilum sp. X52]|uniref:GNAT family N-acetyltransferase n=1 Tax=Proteiniphilum sp. X52 TaxID=2382159 RepID=UPI000F0A6BAB|nr:GNAT family N-acetyltransferase [Proteiniphilum sp. X52]RNC64728.1 GNAT family N-acetyltransferase [Proteiniphilum sp. X52]
MEDVKETIRICGWNTLHYSEFRSKLTGLYLHAFTTGGYAQFIAPETVEVTLDNLFHDGTGCVAFVGDRLAGLLAAFPLKRDPDFPADGCPHVPVGQSVYIAEVMVHADYRGRGIASQMLKNYLQKASENYSHAVIRVWEKNKPALELYKKLGFVPVAGISQRKLSTGGKEFEMKKVYLAVKIIDCW